eukprot:jgi/Tetstr1/438911/TSEL_027419.t1
MVLKFGNVVESVASNKFRIRWDDGTYPCETTNVLKLQPTGAGALPQIRAHVKFSKAAPGAGPDTWQMFTQMVEDFNRNMMTMLVMGVWITFDEAMSAYQPRSTKTGGLPNISFIKRKPKPLGNEGKTACDCATGVMIHFEIQEGRDAMRLKEHAPELVAVGKTGRHFIGCVKTSHSL